MLVRENECTISHLRTANFGIQVNWREARPAGTIRLQISVALQKKGKWPELSNQTNSFCGALIVWLYSQVKEGRQYGSCLPLETKIGSRKANPSLLRSTFVN